MLTVRRNILIAIIALFASPALVWAETTWQEGEHYTVVSPAVRVGPTDQNFYRVFLVRLRPLLYV